MIFIFGIFIRFRFLVFIFTEIFVKKCKIFLFWNITKNIQKALDWNFFFVELLCVILYFVSSDFFFYFWVSPVSSKDRWSSNSLALKKSSLWINFKKKFPQGDLFFPSKVLQISTADVVLDDLLIDTKILTSFLWVNKKDKFKKFCLVLFRFVKKY